MGKIAVKSPPKRFLLRMPEGLWLALQGRLTHQSMNQTCVEFIQQALNNDQNAYSETVKSILEVYSSHKNLKAIVLFGSQARGLAHETSDVDLLLVFENSTELNRGLYKVWENSDFSSRLKNISIHCAHLPSLKEDVSSLWLEVSLDGKVLWSQNSDLNRLMDHVKDLIAGGKYVREHMHGHRYWRRVI